METETPAGHETDALPSLPARLLAVIVSPGRLVDQLARHPRWVGALIVSTFLIVLSVTVIPADIFVEAQREAMIERGVDPGQLSGTAVRAMRLIIPVTTGVMTVIMTFVFAGLYTVIFAFVLGDEGRYVQYLATVTHAWFIPALFSLFLAPLRIQTGDPQFTLSLGAFFSFLPDGYALNVLRVMDLTQIWSMLVVAQGAHAIDKRRSFASAAVIVLAVFTCFALVIGRFLP